MDDDATLSQEIDEILKTEARNMAVFWAWVRLGVKRGWISPPYCGVHEVTPLTRTEAKWVDEGSDPCVYVARLMLYTDNLMVGGDE
jgi:hypothetical protein